MNTRNRCKNLFTGLLLAAGFSGAPAAQAALNDLGGGLIYDTNLDITWLADANYSDTSNYNTTGQMSWNAANNWADGLVYGGHDNWRLPTISEMTSLFYDSLEGIPGTSIHTIHNNANYDLFTNIQANQNSSGHYYWSAAPVDANNALAFAFQNGFESTHNKTDGLYAWAVHPSVVPEPETYALMFAGLGLLGMMARRRRR